MISGGQENKKGLGGNGGSSEVFRGFTKSQNVMPLAQFRF